MLASFYERVRPGGPGWAHVSERLGLRTESIPGGALAWTNWVAGIVAVYATLFGIGKDDIRRTGRRSDPAGHRGGRVRLDCAVVQKGDAAAGMARGDEVRWLPIEKAQGRYWRCR